MLNNAPYIIKKTHNHFLNEDNPNRKLELLNATFAQLFRYVGCIFLSEYMEDEESNIKVNNEINKLIRPSLGSWLGFIRVFIKYKASNKPFMHEIEEVFSNIAKSRFQVLKGDIRSKSFQSKDAASAILEMRNMLAHGATPPTKDEAEELLNIYTPCIECILQCFTPIFENYKIGNFISIEEGFLNQVAVFSITSESDKDEIEEVTLEDENVPLKENDLYLISNDNRILSLSCFFSDIFDPNVYNMEKYFIYDGLLNRSVIYSGVESRCQIEQYIDAIRKKFSSKEILMQWKKEGFRIEEFNEYINELSIAAVNLNEKSGKYNKATYMERKYDNYIEDFLNSDKTVMVIKAEAGVGKTSLLCHATETCISNKKTVYYVNGAGLIDEEGEYPIFSKLKKDGLDKKSFKSIQELFELLNDYNQNKDKFVIVVDAVNEALNSLEVLEEIDTMANLGSLFPWLKIIMSIRTTSYEILKDRIRDEFGKQFPLFKDISKYYTITEGGKTTREIEVKEWVISEERNAFENYKKATPSEAPSFHKLSNELRELLKNPLNMSIYFKVISNDNSKNIVTEKELFEAFHHYLTEKDLTRTPELILNYIIDRMYQNKSTFLDLDEVINFSEKLTKNSRYKNLISILTPYERLKDMGILHETIGINGLSVNFVYQKHFEYMLYRYILNKNMSIEEIISYFIESADWDTLKEANIAFLHVLSEYNLSNLSLITEHCNKENIPLSKIQSNVTSFIIHRISNSYNDEFEKNLTFIFDFLEKNNILKWSTNIIKILFANGHISQAEDFGIRIQKYNHILSKEDIIEWNYSMGLVYQSQSKMEKALSHFEDAYKSCNLEDKSLYLMQIAKTHRQNGSVDKAEEILEDYIKKCSDDDKNTIFYAEILAQRGLCYYARKDYEKALELYEKADEMAIKFKDDYFRLYNLLGKTAVLECFNKIDEAVDLLLYIYEEANRLGHQASYVDAMNGLASKNILLEKYEEAIYWAKEGLVLWEYSKFYRGQMVMCSHIIRAIASMKETKYNIDEYIEKGNALKKIVKEKLILKEFDNAVDFWRNKNSQMQVQK